jgi:hypothetical protein
VAPIFVQALTRELHQHLSVPEMNLGNMNIWLPNSLLSCKPIKCQFEQQFVKYLRMIIGHGHTAINPKKATAIMEWLIPKI